MLIRVNNPAWVEPVAAGAHTWAEFSFIWPATGYVTGLFFAELGESDVDRRAELELRIMRRTRELVTVRGEPDFIPACVEGGRLDFAQMTDLYVPVEALEEWRIQARRTATDVRPDLYFRLFTTIEGEGDMEI